MSRFLVCSGGGSKGAWTCGTFQHLLGDLKINYSGYCGVSVGGINVSFLSQFMIGQEYESAKLLKEMWLKLDNSKIYKSWKPFGRLHAIWKSSFYDSSPLQKL